MGKVSLGDAAATGYRSSLAFPPQNEWEKNITFSKINNKIHTWVIFFFREKKRVDLYCEWTGKKKGKNDLTQE